MQYDGGAGNPGYMAQGEKEEKKEKRYLEESIFMKKDEGDIFSFDKEPTMPEEKSPFTKIVEQVMSALKKLFGKK